MGYGPLGHKESDMTEVTSHHEAVLKMDQARYVTSLKEVCFLVFLSCFFLRFIYSFIDCDGSSLLHTGLSIAMVHQLLIVLTSLLGDHRLQAHGLQ